MILSYSLLPSPSSFAYKVRYNNKKKSLLRGIDMGNQSSRPNPEQDVSKNEPNQSSSTVASTSSESASLHLTARTSSVLNYNPLDRVVFVNLVALYAAKNAINAFELKCVNSTWEDTIENHTLKNNSKLGFTQENLLYAVTRGMESKNVNLERQPADVFAADILGRYPEYLLEKSDITDWGGRTFKNITAFEYALWAKDFKMIEMMLKCIPETEAGNEIRAGLREQYEQVTAPIHAGGGLTYELTYDRPVQNGNGIPLKDAAGGWQTSSVTETHTENHFDLNPLLNAYQDFNERYDDRTWPQRDDCWIKVVGTLQRLLPINILQRYCDLDTPFYPLPTFTGSFRRTLQFYNLPHKAEETLLSSSLSSDFSLAQVGGAIVGGAALSGSTGRRGLLRELAAVRLIDKVSKNEIEKIKRLLATPGEKSPTQFRP